MSNILTPIYWCQSQLDAMQPRGEGASCPVKFKECSAPTGSCGRGTVLILLDCLTRYTVPGKHCTCLSSPARPCLYLRMVAQSRWFADIVRIKKKSQFEVLTVRMQDVGFVCLSVEDWSSLGRTRLYCLSRSAAAALFLLMWWWLHYPDHWVHSSDKQTALVGLLE